MAGPLAAVERFFERLFERPAARLFQARVEPVQIQRSLERAVEADRKVQARRTYAPTSYRVLINKSDYESLQTEVAKLRAELSESLRVYARSHGYTLLARPEIAIEPSPVVDQGDVRVFAAPIVVPGNANGDSHGASVSQKIPALSESDGADVDEASIDISHATAVFAAPSPTIPRAVMAIRSPDQAVSRLDVRPGTTRVGRALDNDVVLNDERVSRHHGQITARLGMLVYTDLGSTNGSLLNSAPVTEIALGPGDVLQLGSSTITIEPGS